MEHEGMDQRPAPSAECIAGELRAWQSTGLRIAIWGSAAESVAFLETHGVEAWRFPTMVDSDPAQASMYVPGVGQVVHSPDWLLDHPVDIILIPSPRRAVKIVRQIDASRIAYEGILIPREGHLVDFHAAEMLLA